MCHRECCFDLCHHVCYLFFSMSFIVSGLTFRSLIHFKFIFMYGIRKCSNFILLHIAYFPAPLIEEAIFASLCVLPSFVKNKVPISLWAYFWALCLVPVVYISVFVPVSFCLMTAALCCSLRSGRMIPAAPSSFSTLLWLFRVFCVSI